MSFSLFGIPLFEGFSAVQLAGLGLVFFASYFLKGAFGFGSLTPAILFASWIIEPHHAVLLAMLANCASQVQFIPEGVRHGSWPIVRTLLAANFVGAAIGIAIFSNLDGRGLTLALGIALGLVVLCDVLKLPEKLGEHVDVRGRVAGWLIAAFSGLVSGLTGAGGLFFMAYYVRLSSNDPRSFRATTLLLSSIIVAFRTAVLAYAGFVNPQLLLETLCLAPFYVTGGWIGTVLFGRLSPKHFFMGIQVLLLMASAGLVYKSLGG